MSKHDHLAILEENIEALQESLKWLQRSYDICKERPLSQSDPETMDAFEGLTGRFARTTDILFNKVLKSIVFLEEEEYKTWIDMMLFLQKKEVIKNIEDARLLKELRNDIVHEYGASDIVEIFKEVLDQTTLVFQLSEQVMEEADQLKGKLR